MDAQMVVIVAGIILFVAVIGSLLFLRGYSSKFTFDTKNGTRPAPPEGEGNTGVAMKGRSDFDRRRWRGICWGRGEAVSMQMVSSDYYEGLSQDNQTRTVTTPAPRGRILDRNGVELVTNRPSLCGGCLS